MRPGRQVRVTGQEAIRSGADRKRMNEHSEPTRAREGGGRNRHVHATRWVCAVQQRLIGWRKDTM